MTTILFDMTSQEVAKRVRRYIDKVNVSGVTISFNEAEIQLYHGYWKIPLHPSKEPEPMFPYFEALANLEAQIQESEGIKVSISSGEPLTEE